MELKAVNIIQVNENEIKTWYFQMNQKKTIFKNNIYSIFFQLSINLIGKNEIQLLKDEKYQNLSESQMEYVFYMNDASPDLAE